MGFSVLRMLFVLFVLSIVLGCAEDSPRTSPAAKKGGVGGNELPDFERLPLRLGLWKGQDLPPLDPWLLAGLKMDACVSRTYQEALGDSVALLIAVISDWDVSRLPHDPMVCYAAGGWQLVSESEEPVDIGDGKTIRVSLSTWQKEQHHIRLLFWYQIGDQIVLRSSDLDSLPSGAFNEEQPPRLVKVQLQVSLPGTSMTKLSIKALAREIGKWIDEPYYD